MEEAKKLFALDIGTRSIVGIILEQQEDQFHVIDILIQEHTERAMLDGQIHDVLAVSKIITQIKEQLETKHGPLKKVSVAAAGRSLKTKRAVSSIGIQGKPMMNKQDILHLELSAVQQAQASVAEDQESEKSAFYYCVGYSILYYKLDGEEIGNLIDQQGEEASVEIIATFLPKVVVESLMSALHRSDLEMEALTLEPIAAINVLIPQSMRRLNVALVDIGAGTSDIAITDLGTVVAYGMVPVAGDEITEAISDQLLLDFPRAEQAKRELLTNDSIQVEDILGFETEVTKSEMIEQISPAINRLTDAICDEILTLNNNKQPKAVMLVGGGSQTPALAERIADKLQLPANRVAIRGIEAIHALTISEHISRGPELVTPIGIAIAAHKAPVQYKTVYVNEQPVRLFEVTKLTVGDCLLASGIKMNKLYGKPGLAMIVSLNGHQITIPGSHGEAPLLMKNGDLCGLDDKVQSGDEIIVSKGLDGLRAQVLIHDLIDELPNKTIYVNDQEYTLHAIITRNGEPVGTNHLVLDHDVIKCTVPDTISEMLTVLNLQNLLDRLKPFKLKINGKDTVIPSFSGTLLRNGSQAKMHNSIEHGDKITISNRTEPTLKDLMHVKQMDLECTLPVSFNNKEIQLKKPLVKFKRNGEELALEDFIFDGDALNYIEIKQEPFIFQDIFKAVEINMPQNANGSFLLLKNGENATFYDPLNAGDQLEIVWPIKQMQTYVNKTSNMAGRRED
ncbi:cell division protein FtsA [Cytobacillus gottheilii]|uniref:cell division protein FtsA n=1 Tax=Cytobacillus gottheilii TaxID=859144 RepID=UPI0009BA2C63|nr:cell division protein FtsA [Cytobacillus gottheilii]